MLIVAVNCDIKGLYVKASVSILIHAYRTKLNQAQVT